MEISVNITVNISEENEIEINKQVNDQIQLMLKDKDYIQKQVVIQADEFVQEALTEFFNDFDAYDYNDNMIEEKATLYDLLRPVIELWIEENKSKYKDSVMKKIEDGLDEILAEKLMS